MRWFTPVIFLYLGGHIWFSLTAVFKGQEEWDGTTAYEKYYFLWNDFAGAGWLVWILIYVGLKGNTYRKNLIPIIIFSIFNFGWDIFSFISNWGMNHPVMTGVFFGVAALTAIFFMVKDVIREWKSLK